MPTAPILSSYDWLTRNNGEIHLRSGFYTGELGPEIISNGSFADGSTGWTTGSGWDLTGGNATHIPGNTDSLSQTNIADNNGATYRLTFLLSGIAGSLTVLLGDAGGTKTYNLPGDAGNISVDLIADTNEANVIYFNPSNDFDGAITSISIKSLYNGKLQYRYVSANGTVTWRDLITGVSPRYNFTTFWDTSESLRECLFVNGLPQIQRWNGAVTTFASATATTLTKEGTDTWLDAGFYVNSTRSIVINGVTATYTGGENTTTLTGVSVDFSTSTIGDVIHQGVRTTVNGDMQGITATFANALISTLNNQVFVGALNSSVVWISKVNSFTDYTSSTPRQVGEGASLILDNQIVAFMPQENYMYVSSGKDLWYNISFQIQTSTVGITYEQVSALPLKTGKQQGALSQAFVSHMKNNIIIVTNEPTIDMMGRLENFFGTPMVKNISDPIKLDIDSYDFTDGSIFYFQYYIYVAIPKNGIVLIYNLATNSWESPQTLPISRFYIVDGELYGHSYSSSESYKLFTGYADRVYPGFSGYPIDAKMKFSYQNFGSRFNLKNANYLYVEGYINPNTTILATLTYEIDGCATTKTFEINGSDTQIVCIPSPQGSLGKASLGKLKLGGDDTGSIQNLPPKFRVEKSFTNTDFFECSLSFEILGVDNRMEVLAFALNAELSTQEPVSIRQ